MKIKFIIFFIIYLLTFNAKAAISQDGITNLTQLGKQDIIGLISGNQLTGFVSDGPFEGPIVQRYFKDGRYETFFEDKIYKGVWTATRQDKKLCTKNNTAKDFNCVYWYTGVKDGGTYAYIIALGKIFHQYHEVKSLASLSAEEKKTPKSMKKTTEKTTKKTTEKTTKKTTEKTTKKPKKIFVDKWV